MYTHLLADCTLCPRECHVNRLAGQTGYCRQTAEVRVARASLHLWEEPCISGARGSGTVFFSGCALGCVYCQNYRVSRGQVGKTVTTERLAETFLTLEAQGAHNLNLVTPSHFLPQIVEALTLARKQGLQLPVVYNCGGYEKAETLQLLAGYVDIYLPDLKYCSPDLARKYSHCTDYFQHASIALAEMVRQVGEPVFRQDGLMARGVIVRHLLLPGQLQDSMDVIRYLHQEFGNQIYISIMSQYTPLSVAQEYPELQRKVSTEEYDRLVDYAISLGVENGFIQEGDAALESFIPEFG